MIRRRSHLVIVAAVALAILALAVQADPVPVQPVAFDAALLPLINQFFELVSATVPCTQWVSYWAPTGTFYHPAFPVASGTSGLLSMCNNVRNSMNGPTSVFLPVGPQYITTTTTSASGSTGAQPITHLLIPYHFATSPATGNASDVFMNTGYEYLQFVPNPSPATAGSGSSSSAYPYLLLQATEFFQRREVPFNWTDYDAGAAPNSLQGLLNTLHRELDTTLPCSGWGSGAWRAASDGSATYYTLDQSTALTVVPNDYVAFCTNVRASDVTQRSAERQNGAYLTHTTSDGSVHVLVPYTSTLYWAEPPMPPSTSINTRVGWRALLLAAPTTPGAGYKIVRATQFMTRQNLPYPAQAASNNGGSGDCGGGIRVGWVVALVLLWTFVGVAITACVCTLKRRKEQQQSGTYSRMAG